MGKKVRHHTQANQHDMYELTCYLIVHCLLFMFISSFYWQMYRRIEQNYKDVRWITVGSLSLTVVIDLICGHVSSIIKVTFISH